MHTFLIKSKLQEPSNNVKSIEWNNVLLFQAVLPLTLLEICIDDVAKNKNVVSVQNYITLSYVWLSFFSVVHIGSHKVYKIRQASLNF